MFFQLIGSLSAVDNFLENDLAEAVTKLNELPDISHGIRDPAPTSTAKVLIFVIIIKLVIQTSPLIINLFLRKAK